MNRDECKERFRAALIALDNLTDCIPRDDNEKDAIDLLGSAIQSTIALMRGCVPQEDA